MELCKILRILHFLQSSSPRSPRENTNTLRKLAKTAEYSFDNTVHYSTKNDIKRSRNREHEETLAGLQERMNGDQKRANEIAQMKGASNWLTSLPIREENYVLNKREIYDAIRMRYRWPFKFIPTTCACEKRFLVNHALSCLKGGFVC